MNDPANNSVNLQSNVHLGDKKNLFSISDSQTNRRTMINAGPLIVRIGFKNFRTKLNNVNTHSFFSKKHGGPLRASLWVDKIANSLVFSSNANFVLRTL